MNELTFTFGIWFGIVGVLVLGTAVYDILSDFSKRRKTRKSTKRKVFWSSESRSGFARIARVKQAARFWNQWKVDILAFLFMTGKSVVGRFEIKRGRTRGAHRRVNT